MLSCFSMTHKNTKLFHTNVPAMWQRFKNDMVLSSHYTINDYFKRLLVCDNQFIQHLFGCKLYSEAGDFISSGEWWLETMPSFVYATSSNGADIWHSGGIKATVSLYKDTTRAHPYVASSMDVQNKTMILRLSTVCQELEKY